jgi:hypothetical protein
VFALILLTLVGCNPDEIRQADALEKIARILDYQAQGCIRNPDMDTGHGWLEGGWACPSHTPLCLPSTTCDAPREGARCKDAIGNVFICARVDGGYQLELVSTPTTKE